MYRKFFIRLCWVPKSEKEGLVCGYLLWKRFQN
jgi:hypothetical protein